MEMVATSAMPHFIHSFTKYLMRTYYLPGSTAGTEIQPWTEQTRTYLKIIVHILVERKLTVNAGHLNKNMEYDKVIEEGAGEWKKLKISIWSTVLREVVSCKVILEQIPEEGRKSISMWIDMRVRGRTFQERKQKSPGWKHNKHTKETTRILG